MPVTIEPYLIVIAILLILSVAASKLSDRFGIPALVMFLIIGMLAGSEGPGGIYFDNPLLTQSIGIAALSIILFSGGLDTEWESIRPVLKEGLLLATLGVVITAAVVGVFAHLLLGISLLQGMLLASIISSTDAAAVFAILRSKGVSLKGNIKPLLELESGSNDPMAVFLTVGLIQLLQNPGQSPASLIVMFFQQMLIGAAVGWLVSQLMLFSINRLRLGYDGIYPVLVLGWIFLAFGIAFVLGGSGFLAVYVAGLLVGKANFLHKRSLQRFYDGMAWLMQITMFLTLGLFVFPSHLAAVALPGLAISAVLMLVARPLAVMLGLSLTKFPLREKIFIAWVGLRGAVPIILGTYPLVAGLEQSGMFFNIVFFAVLTSVLLQGYSLPFAARKLKVEAPPEDGGARLALDAAATNWAGKLREIRLPERSWANGRAIYELHLPQNLLIVMINRNEGYILPNGSVVVQPGDVLLTLSDQESFDRAVASLNRPAET